MPPASTLSPSRTAVSFCSSRVIREYEADTLLREYRRDVARFLAGEREHYPPLPLGYFDDGAAAVATAFQARALRDPRNEPIAEFPKSALESGLQCPWRAAALGTYEKWCAYLSARKAERRTAALPLPGVRQRRTWRDWPLGAHQPPRSSLP